LFSIAEKTSRLTILLRTNKGSLNTYDLSASSTASRTYYNIQNDPEFNVAKPTTIKPPTTNKTTTKNPKSNTTPMSDLDPQPANPPLTPRTLSAAEEALRYNEALQTASAGAPQPTTPSPSRRTSNYAAAAHHSGLSWGAPYPASFRAHESTDSAASEAPSDDAAFAPPDPGCLSRGTTQAVLRVMASPDFVAGRARAKRLGREDERGAEGHAEHADGEDAPKKLGVERQMSWSVQDRKRAMAEGLMGPVDESGNAGYSSAGGET